MHLKFTAADKTDVGKQRDQNEDCAYKRVESSEEGDRGLFIVADGMGGYKAGEVASRLADKRIRTSSSPYKISYARVAAGIMNFPQEIEKVLREIRALATKSASA